MVTTEKKSLTWRVQLSIALFVCDAGLAVFTWARLQPPSPVSEQAPLVDFSAERAMRHVRALSRQPRPIGSPAHARARAYILQELVQLGLKPDTQKSLASVHVPGFNWISSGQVENIYVMVPGTAPVTSAPLLLAAHYDSVRNSKGASDDAAGVATLLETLRALRTVGAAPLRQPLLVLFSDGEENALLGAHAFLAESPAARHIGMALNFEARGSGGPSSMYEASALQGPLIEEFARAGVPRSVTNSFVPAVARFLPNDTDFSVFRSHGIPGLSFAYAGGVEHYHSFIDDEKRIDPGSLQQHGDYALALARSLGNLDRFPPPGPDRIYFDLFGSRILSYPVSWMPWLSALCVLLLLFRVYRRGAGAAVVRGTAAIYLAGTAALAAVTGVAYAANKLRPSLLIQHSSAPITAGYVLLALGLYFAVLSRFRQPERMSAWLALFIVLPALEAFMPGASYVLHLPLIAVLAWPALTAVGAMIFSYAAYIFYIAVGAGVPALICIPVLGYVCLAWPRLEGERHRNQRVWGAFAATGLVVIALTLVFARYSSEFPEPSFVNYAVDLAQPGAPAYWVTDPELKHAWIDQFRDQAVSVAGKNAPWFSPSASDEPLLFAPAPAPKLALPAPELQVLESRPADSSGIRRVRLRLRSRRGARCLIFWEEEGRELKLVKVGGKPVHQYLRISPEADKWLGSFFRPKSSADWTLSFCAAPKEGIELELETPSKDPLKVRYQDKSEGLPLEFPTSARPPELMPSGSSDVIVLSRSAQI